MEADEGGFSRGRGTDPPIWVNGFLQGVFFGLLDKSTYRLAALEDDAAQREHLLEALKGYPRGEAFAIEEFSCSRDLERRMEAVRFDVLLCDISLGSDAPASRGCEKAPADCQGIEFVRRHASADGFMQVVYVSGSSPSCSVFPRCSSSGLSFDPIPPVWACVGGRAYGGYGSPPSPTPDLPDPPTWALRIERLE